jgi:hypothetical protein
VQSIYKTYL